MMMKICLLLIVSLLLGIFADGSAASSSASPSSQQHKQHRRPPFVEHVDREALQVAAALARERHGKAVKTALANFPTDVGYDDPSAVIDEELLGTIELVEREIDAPGSLPDFASELDRRIYVTDKSTPLLSPEECRGVIKMAEDHFAETAGGQWTTHKSGDFDIAGFLIKDVSSVQDWFVKTVQRRLFPLLAKTFPEFCENPEDLCVDNAYLFKYTTETGRRSDIHTDSGCLSFTISLNPNSDYTGGGTWFEGLVGDGDKDDNGVLEMDVGQVTIRPGGVKHCGNAVESGTRYIIGGFCMHKSKPEAVRMLLTPQPGEEVTVDALEAAIALNPNCDAAYSLLADLRRRAGQADKAREVLEYCLENVHGSSGIIAYPLGCLNLDEGKYDEARRCMEICLKADPNDADAMTGLARICSAQGDRDGEERCYRRIVATPSATNKHLAGAYCNLGTLREGRQGGGGDADEDDEITCYKKALEYDPDMFVARYSLGCAYGTREQYADAVENLRRAVPLADSPEHRAKALQSLYKAAAYHVRSSTTTSSAAAAPPSPQQQQVMMEQLKDLMGAENYEELAASAGKR